MRSSLWFDIVSVDVSLLVAHNFFISTCAATSSTHLAVSKFRSVMCEVPSEKDRFVSFRFKLHKVNCIKWWMKKNRKKRSSAPFFCIPLTSLYTALIRHFVRFVYNSHLPLPFAVSISLCLRFFSCTQKHLIRVKDAQTQRILHFTFKMQQMKYSTESEKE